MKGGEDMDNKRFELLPGMDEETFEGWLERRKLTENDLVFIFKSVKYHPEYTPEKITVKDVATRLNRSVRYIQLCLQEGKLPFGTAVKLDNKRYQYIIYPEKFRTYLGETGRGEN